MDGYLLMLGATALCGLVAIYYGYHLLTRTRDNPAGQPTAIAQQPRT